MTTRLVVRNLAAVGAVLTIGMTTGRGSIQDSGSRTTVIIYTDTAASSLSDRWNWATAEAGRKGFGKGYWVGYSIVKEMGERSLVGSFYSDKRRNHPSLGELVTGVQVDELPPVSDESFGSMSGTMNFDDDENGKPRRMVKKEVGFLLHFGGERAGEINDLGVSNMSLRVELDNDPLIWVGGAGYEESVTFLDGAYGKTTDPGVKEEFIVAIGLHNESKKAISMLSEILTGTGDPELREDAAFWLGQTNTAEARKILNDVAWKDGSQDVREKAIFSMSQMDGEESVDLMIALAKGHKDDETRKQAAFWLGQKASEKAVGALKDLAYTDEDTEVQRSAMYALAQVDEGGGVDELIKIARTHPNPKIRKDAIYWLGQCEDPRALDVLVDIVKGK